MPLLLLLLLFLPALAMAEAPANFEQAKTHLIKIHQELAQQFPEAKGDFYCCLFSTDSKGSECKSGFFTKKGKVTQIAETNLSWEHVLPVNVMEQALGVNRGKARECRQAGDFVKPFPPWEPCDRPEEIERVKSFHQLEGNPYNLWPTALTLNKARSNYPLVPLPKQEQLTGCPLRVEKKSKVNIKEPNLDKGFVWKQTTAWQAEIPLHNMGRVARIYLYLDQTYPALRLKDQLPQSDQWEAWNRQFPANDYECARYHLILKETNLPNPVLEQACLPRGLAKQK